MYSAGTRQSGTLKRLQKHATLGPVLTLQGERCDFIDFTLAARREATSERGAEEKLSNPSDRGKLMTNMKKKLQIKDLRFDFSHFG